MAGVCYAFVAVPAQTSLQEELPPDVRGRVFGVLNMLVSLASFVPIIIVGPLADFVSAAAVIVVSALIVGAVGVVSMLFAHPARDRLGTTREHRAGRPDDDHDGVVDAQPARAPALHRRRRRGPIHMIASPVVPGRAGPAPQRPPDAAHG